MAPAQPAPKLLKQWAETRAVFRVWWPKAPSPDEIVLFADSNGAPIDRFHGPSEVKEFALTGEPGVIVSWFCLARETA